LPTMNGSWPPLSLPTGVAGPWPTNSTLFAFALAPSFGVAKRGAAGGRLRLGSLHRDLNTLVLANVGPRFHGRVMSVYLITFAASPVAALPMSWLADRVGASATIAAVGSSWLRPSPVSRPSTRSAAASAEGGLSLARPHSQPADRARQSPALRPQCPRRRH